jgi:PAS domain S-box-containing protein
VLDSLDVIESALPLQIDTMSDLARAEDWSAIRLRTENQVKQLSYLTASLVDEVATEVAEERAQVLSNIQQGERRALLTLLGTCSITLLVAAALGLAVTRSITHPLVVLDRGAQALARGDFVHQVLVTGNDELADLGNVFNHTARQLCRLYETLRESEARFRSLIEHSSDFIILLDSEGTIRHVSPSTERALTLNSDDLVGKSIFKFIHPDDSRSARTAISDRTPKVVRTFEFRYRHRGGELRTIEAVTTNLLAEPAVAGLVLNARDITERKRAEEKLARSEAFLAEGEALSHTGSWGWRVPSREVTWSSEQFRILGYEPGTTKPSLAMFWRRVHSEDRPRLRVVLEQAEKSDVETEFRVCLPDRSVRHIHSVSHAVIDESGQLVELIGTSIDITARKHAEDALRASELNLRLVVDSIPGLVNTMTAEGENEFVSQQVLDYFGKSHEELKHWATSDFIHADDLPRVVAAFESSIETGQPYDTEHRIRRADGVYRWFHVRALPLLDTEGRMIRWYVLSTDIDKRKQAEDRLQLLLDVTNQVVSNLQLRDLLRAISGNIRRVMQCDCASLALPNAENKQLQLNVLDFPEGKGFFHEEGVYSIEGSPYGTAFRTMKPLALEKPFGTWLDNPVVQSRISEGFKSLCFIPLMRRNRARWVSA